MAIREKFSNEKPLRDVKLTGSLHMTIQTAVLIETLQDLGASVRWASCNIFSTQDQAAAAIAKENTPVFAWKGMSLEEYWECTLLALSHPNWEGPDLIVDDGGDATLLIHKGYELENGSEWVNTPSSSLEEECIKNILKRKFVEADDFWTKIFKQVLDCWIVLGSEQNKFRQFFGGFWSKSTKIFKNSEFCFFVR